MKPLTLTQNRVIYRDIEKNLDEQNHHHGRASAIHLQLTPFHIDPACG